MGRQPEARPQMVIVSDMHLEKGKPVERLHSLISEVIGDPAIRVFVLPGDIVDKSLCHDGAHAVALEFARLNDPKVGRKISTIYVEGNDEQHMDPEVRQHFYQQLEGQGVTVFKAGENNYTRVQDENGQDIAAFIGIPWTLPPEVYDNIYFGKVDSEFLDVYHKAAYALYGQKFLEDLQQAAYGGLPTYLVFHAPPFPQAYGSGHDTTDTVSLLPSMGDIINIQELVVGAFYGHINCDPSVITTEAGIAFVGVHEKVVRQEGQGYGYLACQLPRAGQDVLDVRSEFAREMQASRRTQPTMQSRPEMAIASA